VARIGAPHVDEVAVRIAELTCAHRFGQTALVGAAMVTSTVSWADRFRARHHGGGVDTRGLRAP
jgi:hypothetical protein